MKYQKAGAISLRQYLARLAAEDPERAALLERQTGKRQDETIEPDAADQLAAVTNLFEDTPL